MKSKQFLKANQFSSKYLNVFQSETISISNIPLIQTFMYTSITLENEVISDKLENTCYDVMKNRVTNAYKAERIVHPHKN